MHDAAYARFFIGFRQRRSLRRLARLDIAFGNDPPARAARRQKQDFDFSVANHKRYGGDLPPDLHHSRDIQATTAPGARREFESNSRTWIMASQRRAGK